MSIITKMDHFTILSTDLAATQAFYEMFGLSVGPRPAFSFGGLWFYCGKTPILHVVEKQEIPQEPGVLDHMAFSGTDINALLQRLTLENVGYTISQLPNPFKGWQVFFLDPNNAKVEIAFDIKDIPDEHHLNASLEQLR
ncbi:MAG: dioxygenase [Robiginitomaculum sp.]|nr:MAG: dioxygenase [Robiginitomaculum sp.]